MFELLVWFARLGRQWVPVLMLQYFCHSNIIRSLVTVWKKASATTGWKNADQHGNRELCSMKDLAFWTFSWFSCNPSFYRARTFLSLLGVGTKRWMSLPTLPPHTTFPYFAQKHKRNDIYCVVRIYKFLGIVNVQDMDVPGLRTNKKDNHTLWLPGFLVLICSKYISKCKEMSDLFHGALFVI